MLNYIKEKYHNYRKRKLQKNILKNILIKFFVDNIEKNNIIVNENITITINIKNYSINISGFRLAELIYKDGFFVEIPSIEFSDMFYEICFESMELIINKLKEELEKEYNNEEMYNSYEKTIHRINKLN